MTNKNIIVGVVVVLVVLVVVGGVFLLFKSKTPSIVDMGSLASDESELTAFQADIDLFAGDEPVLSELEQTLGDVAGAEGEINVAQALDSASISQEGSEVDFSKDLAGFTSDEATSQELDQALGEVSQ